jgi:hypothetical protein
MSSSIDSFECPRCGSNARREQDNRTCKVTYNCPDCGWDDSGERDLEKIRENLEIWLNENENSEMLYELYENHLKDKREIKPKYFISYERFLKRYYFEKIYGH